MLKKLIGYYATVKPFIYPLTAVAGKVGKTVSDFIRIMDALQASGGDAAKAEASLNA